MTFSLIRLASAPLLAFAVVASCFAQVELRTQTLDPELSRRTGADDGFGFPGYDPGAPTEGEVSKRADAVVSRSADLRAGWGTRRRCLN